MPLNYKTGHFLIKRETAKDPSVLSNFVDRQALFNYYDQKPFQDVTSSLSRKTILDNDMGEMATPFSDFLKTNNKKITVTEDKLRYKKSAKTPVHFRLLKSVTGKPGLRRENFNIVVNSNAFKPGMKIGPEEGFQFIMVVQSLPRIVGEGYEYTVRSLDPNPHAYFPTGFLREGTRIVPRGSTNVSEGSSEWGPTLWQKGTAVLTWEVGLFATGKELKITNDALNHVFTLDPCNEKGELDTTLPKTFLSEAELNFRMEIEREMEEDLLWSQYNTTIIDGSTRLARKIGAGVFDFIKDGHIYDYNPTFENSSIRELTDFTESIWYNNIGSITYGTGKPGLELAGKWIRREFGEQTVIREYDHFIERTGYAFPGGPEAWKLKKPTFNAYELDGGGVVTFELWPWLDDRSFRGTKHPKTGKPLLGYHFIGSRYTGKGIDSNITLATKKGAEQWGYDPGATGLYGVGAGGKNLMTHAGRYATLRHENSYGLFVEDVNDFVWFRPNIK